MRMKVLVVGGGGREHALAWKLAQSPQVEQVLVAPGNGGTAQARGTSRDIAQHPAPAWVRGSIRNAPDGATSDMLAPWARAEKIDLTVVGPEAPLAEGIVDAFQAAGMRCFGPTRLAARLEASKTFAKAFMARHGIPTARYGAFSRYEEAREYLRSVDFEVVVKASGLAAGKGVIVTSSRDDAEAALRQVMVERAFGAAGDEVVIEERLRGQEASVLAFSDGRSLSLMPPAQDHKPAYDGDLGPNTGGMGAYAPAPLVSPVLAEEVRRSILQPAVDGLRADGTPYVGVLYAGLMITPDGPKLLEFNCRFGDPETQAILPLLETDLADVLVACLDGALDRLTPQWHRGAAAAVVAAAGGYPGSYSRGQAITGLGEAGAIPGVVVFHAGTRQDENGQVSAEGGRVLAVTGIGRDLPEAIDRAYDGIGRIHFEGMHYRRDIGAKALGHGPQAEKP